jgi:hypothetical protein
MMKNRYEICTMPGGKQVGVYVLLAHEAEPAEGQLPISIHDTIEKANKAIERYEAADKRREKQK